MRNIRKLYRKLSFLILVELPLRHNTLTLNLDWTFYVQISNGLLWRNNFFFFHFVGGWNRSYFVRIFRGWLVILESVLRSNARDVFIIWGRRWLVAGGRNQPFGLSLSSRSFILRLVKLDRPKIFRAFIIYLWIPSTSFNMIQRKKCTQHSYIYNI